MASLISFSFSTNLFFYHKTPFPGTNIRRLTSGRFVCPVSRRKAGKLILSNHICGDILSLKTSCYPDIFAPKRQFCEPVISQYVESSNAHVLISGFWMGPDVEDGWGFVEAFVHKIALEVQMVLSSLLPEFSQMDAEEENKFFVRLSQILAVPTSLTID
ncbi:unnamed protein product [Fraxinus pennsylvanica]|uniref:Uncharacterized protein n=1 Tax=Fraxinus pennsylvanica TaxID=56036 RepID=A0AAD2DVI6_9LAMI|nr:unnamed protein product [Fraxinus pennsylvanica]